jgi:hypothetical protein
MRNAIEAQDLRKPFKGKGSGTIEEVRGLPVAL